MSYAATKSSIETYFQDNWDQTPVMFDNGESNESGDWVRLVIRNGDAFQASLGDDPTYRHIGVAIVQIFTATDVGSGRALELADLVYTLFRNKYLDGITFKVPQVKEVPNQSEWFQVNVSTEFYRG